MCGRYTLKTPVETLVRRFDLSGPLPGLSPSYNIAPSRKVAAVVLQEGQRRLEMLRWGLVPSWADDPGIGNRMINARAESVAEKPSYRGAFRSRRCLILADGFYEWKRENNGRQPYHIRMRDGSPFAFAGLWESWSGREGEIRSCTIITTDPNDLLAPIHNRMPVILDPQDYDLWLDISVRDPEVLLPLLAPYEGANLEAYPVSRLVNSPTNDDPACVEPVG
ncbi:SOS response-associated peptidase [Rubrobacter calidifluminis]|uniref:SOS response-associated peptidase n=1 Tax=Rubrobacter calidifluminis TaxID=1392640 RepID=UPI0023631831|nr:SOS response-associated peptidase [Rubrobacter calidifluminis]